MKKISILILIVAFSLSAVFSVAAFAVSTLWQNGLDDDTNVVYSDTDIGELPHGHLVEVTYNDLLLNDGSILRNIQYWVDVDALIAQVDVEEVDVIKNVASTLGEIKALYESANFKTKIDNYHLEIGLEYYESYTDLYIANGIDGYEKSQPAKVTKRGFLFNEYQPTSVSIFADAHEQSLINVATSKLSNIQYINTNDITYIYNYGTKYSTKYMMSNADKVYKLDKLNINIHEFVMTKDNLDKPIIRTQRVPNAVVWYIISIVITMIASAFFIWIAILDKKKKSDDTISMDDK